MKTTIDIPDDLYRQVKARSALEGRAIREVTIELYRRWLTEIRRRTPEEPENWLDGWLKMADDAMSGASPGPSARELLEDDRGRLDRQQ